MKKNYNRRDKERGNGSEKKGKIKMKKDGLKSQGEEFFSGAKRKGGRKITKDGIRIDIRRAKRKAKEK